MTERFPESADALLIRVDERTLTLATQVAHLVATMDSYHAIHSEQISRLNRQQAQLDRHEAYVPRFELLEAEFAKVRTILLFIRWEIGLMFLLSMAVLGVILKTM